MFRKPSGKLGFSFNRLVTNAVKNFANDSAAADVDLSPAQQDHLVRYQLQQPDPRVLGPQSFHRAGIVDHPSQSPGVLAALQRASVLSPHPGDPTVYTARIGRQFVHQLAVISVHAQRRLVGMLFFWEEELVRWALLAAEEAEIRACLEEAEREGDAGRGEELRVALAGLQARRRMLPSARGAVSDGAHVLPAYGQAGTVGVQAAGSG
ncbi:hypothetical protein MMC11_008660 [Xylographa trunciseda]|nr:hypothetical protein [Xylographa trunciseda]